MKLRNITINLILFAISFNFTIASDLLFKPLTANTFEGRIGSIIQTNQDNLRLDIGASFDLLKHQFDDNTFVSFGSDFFTYTQLRSEKNFKFPVETSDYFFGINSSLKSKLMSLPISARLRLAHISAHLVDGYSNDGKFFKNPFVYSREFADFTFAFDSLLKNDILNNGIRLYLGLNYVFSNTPDDSESLISNIGFDFENEIIKNLQFALGIDYKYGFNSEDFSQLSSQIGLKYSTNYSRGIFIGYYFYSGNNIHGLFYNEKVNYSGIGFEVFYY